MFRRPNILFVMADQMASAFLPIFGHPLVKTPHLEQLAEHGVIFDSAYCASPLCAPARFSMMAGRLPASIGAWDNAADFAADVPTFAHYLRQAGYRTVLAGKMHFCGPDQLHGFEERLTTDIYPADYSWTPDWERPEVRPSWYHNMLSVVQAGPCRRSNQLDFDEEVIYATRRFLFDAARGSDKRPFCLVVSMTHPHDPYAILPEYWERYKDEEIDLPKLQSTPNSNDPHWHRLRGVSDMDRYEITEAHVRHARRAYYGAISYVDDQLGALLRTLKECEFDADTLVLFTSDHGDMLGERGLWYKMTWHENACRVPLVVGFPSDLTPRRVAESISTVDLLPTLVEIAHGGSDVSYATPVDGRSLLSHLAGGEGHDEALGEYFAEGAIAPLLMIRRGRLKYIRSKPDPQQLYDVVADPLEQTNLAADPLYSSTLANFRNEALNRWNEEDLRVQVIASQRRRHLVASALSRGRRTSWDYQPLNDASQSYIRNHLNLDDLEYRSRLPHVMMPPVKQR
jgi:choline-sulfatase